MRLKIKKLTWPRVIAYIFMLGLVAFSMLPLIYLVSTAFKPMEEMFMFPPRFIVRRPTIKNFGDLGIALSGFTVPFSRYLFNSIFTTVCTVTGTLVICSWGAYGLSKFKLRWAPVIFNIIIAALMFSPHVTQIPSYLLIANLGMVNTYFALILPKLAAAYNIFLMKQFIDQLPDTYLESARIDGANEWFIFWRIVMPMCTPAWTTLIVFSFVANWNDYFSPLIFTTTEQMKNMTLAIQTIGGGLARSGANAAAAFLMTVPTILIFVFMQKKVMDTMMYSGIKG